MKRILFCIAMLCFCLCISAQKQITRSIFDLNGDNRIDIADVTRLINRMCGKKEGDSIVITIAKVDTIHYVVTDTIYEHIKVYVKDTIYVADTYTLDGVEYVMPEAVDLGLPSGNLWASLDLGTNRLEEHKEFDVSANIYDYFENGWLMGSIKGTEVDRALCIGKEWIEPDYVDWVELLTYCDISYLDNRYRQIVVTGQNGNSIIINPYYTTATFIDNRVFCIEISKEDDYDSEWNIIGSHPYYTQLPPSMHLQGSIRPISKTHK